MGWDGDSEEKIQQRMGRNGDRDRDRIHVVVVSHPLLLTKRNRNRYRYRYNMYTPLPLPNLNTHHLSHMRLNLREHRRIEPVTSYQIISVPHHKERTPRTNPNGLVPTHLKYRLTKHITPFTPPFLHPPGTIPTPLRTPLHPQPPLPPPS